jgi:multiple sugar transport system substrate-binding protein
MTTMKTPGRVALMAAASVLALSTAVGADTIRFWTTEEQPERLARQEAMAADFTAETGIEVEVIPVTESDLGTRATAAFAAGDLPDVIYHTLQYALPWYEAGILDADAATEVIETSARTPSRPARWRWRRSTRATPPSRWMAGRR